MIKVAPLEREFIYNGVKLPDPGSELTVEQVRDLYVPTYAELATAAVQGPTPVGRKMQYTFVREVGTKG